MQRAYSKGVRYRLYQKTVQAVLEISREVKSSPKVDPATVLRELRA